MKWFKLYPEKWLLGSTRWELTAEQRAIFIDFLALAALNDHPGEFSYHSVKQLASQIHVRPKNLTFAIETLINTNKIEVDDTAKIIKIKNWRKYQSEYERQKPYRSPEKPESKL
jgi:hypothetical protein